MFTVQYVYAFVRPLLRDVRNFGFVFSLAVAIGELRFDAAQFEIKSGGDKLVWPSSAARPAMAIISMLLLVVPFACAELISPNQLSDKGALPVDLMEERHEERHDSHEKDEDKEDEHKVKDSDKETESPKHWWSSFWPFQLDAEHDGHEDHEERHHEKHEVDDAKKDDHETSGHWWDHLWPFQMSNQGQ